MVKYFGMVELEDEILIATPIGELCAYCGEAIESGDPGCTIPHVDEHGTTERPYHQECHIRMVVGSLGHLKKRCSCYGGTEHDPPGMTPRQAARAAWVYFQAAGGAGSIGFD